MRKGQMLTDLKISCGITFVVRRSNFSALSDFEIITLVPDAPAQSISEHLLIVGHQGDYEETLC